MLIMKKLATSIKETLSCFLLRRVKDELGNIEHLFSDDVPVDEFRLKLKEMNHQDLAYTIKTKRKNKLSKEKLFCLNCYSLIFLKDNKHIENTLSALFEGDYEVKMDELQASSIYNSLDFTSRIFIQERNRSIKKLFV
jgi:hypothetical protein